MPSFREINQQQTQWNRIARLDQNKDQTLDASEIAHAFDRNGDQTLSEEELNNAQIRTPEIRSELQQRYANALQSEAAFEASVFSMPEITERLTQLDSLPAARAAKAARDLGELSGGDTRTILNTAADTNRDGRVSVGEMRQLNIPTVQRLSQEMNVPDMTEQLLSFPDLASALEAEGVDPESNVFAQASGGNAGIFDFFARAQGRPASGAIEAARAAVIAEPLDSTALAARSAELLARAENQPEVSALLGGLQAQGQLNQESFLYLERVLNAHGAETLGSVSQSLNTFLEGTQGLQAEQRPEYIRDVLHDLAYPEDISQGNKATCAAAAVQMKLAMLDPVRYAETATALASGQSVPAELGREGPTGLELMPNQTYEGDASDTRSLSSKVLQNAFMDLGQRISHHAFEAGGNSDEGLIAETHYTRDGREVFYDSRLSADAAQGLEISDEQIAVARNTPGLESMGTDDLMNLGDGLLPLASLALEQQVLGQTLEELISASEPGLENPEQMAQILERIDQNLDANLPVSADIYVRNDSYPDHTVLIVARSTDDPPQYTLNSWGRQYEMSREGLERLINTARVR